MKDTLEDKLKAEYINVSSADDEVLKNLFEAYEPELSSSRKFISRLESNLEAIEVLHQENKRAQKRNRIALWIASISGFIAGVSFTLLLPWINSVLTLARNAIACFMPDINEFADYQPTIAWLIIGFASVFVAMNSYDVIISLLPLRDERLED